MLGRQSNSCLLLILSLYSVFDALISGMDCPSQGQPMPRDSKSSPAGESFICKPAKAELPGQPPPISGSRTQATTPLPQSLRSWDQTTRVCLMCVVSAGLSQGHGRRQAALGEEPSPFLSRASRAAGLVAARGSLRWSLCPARPGSTLGAGDSPRRKPLLFHCVRTCDS